LEQWVANHGSSFSPVRFVTLCSQAEGRKDPELKQFCEKVLNAEWWMLFDHCYAKMG
jgi:hypothetical protein